MSLNKISLTTAVKNQFQYKLNVYTGVFTSLVILQVIGLLVSIGGSGGGISGSEGVEIGYTLYSINNVIIFTFLWGFIHSIMMTTKTDWENSFNFVGNRLTHDVSNMLFLFFASIIGAVLSVLTSFTFRVIIYYFVEEEVLFGDSFRLTGGEIFSGLLTMTLHLFLFCAIGYLLGTITRMHRLLPVLLPFLIIVAIIALVEANSEFLLHFVEFYFEEANPWIFIVKILVSVLLLFGASFLMSSRTEVRR